MPYSAGTAYLQVVPSFLGVEAAMREQVGKLGKSIDDAVTKAIPDGMARGAQAATQEGERAGDNFGGAFATMVRRRLESAIRAIPKIEVDADTKPFDAAMAELRAEMIALGKQKIGVDIDDRTMVAAIANLRARMAEMQQAAEFQTPASTQGFVDLREAFGNIDALSRVAAEAQRRGFEAGDQFGGAFENQANRRIEAATRALPDIQIKADSSAADRAIADLRAQLASLRDVHVGIDISEADFLAKLEYLHAQLKALSADTESVAVRFNLDAAAQEIRRWADTVAPEEGKKAAERLSGAFAETVQQRLRQAMQALPQAQITADSSDAERKVAELRGQLAELSTKRVGIDIDTATARAQITAIQAKLAELAHDKTIDLQVRADAAEASAKLIAIDALARKVNDNKVDVQVNTNADKANISMAQLAATFNLSAGQLAALAALGPALGAAIVPAALASAGAIASIGAAAVSSFVVAYLGLSGVGTAVKALNTYQQQTAKSAESLAVSQNQVASATDSVTNAERSLANTRDNVAQGAVRAAQQVADAQRGVADADRAAQAAQLGLNDAIEAAKRGQEDLAFQVRGNAIAQRQAALDLADAKAKLDAVLLDPQATAAEREQAQITFDQRSLQLDQLGVQQKRLAEDKAKSDQAGIQGSTQVVAAQERIRSANEGVTKAQEALANAVQAQQDQQRQGAFQVEQATQAVVSAQRSLQTATERAGVAGGAAMQNLQTAMNNLSPAGQRFAQFLFGLKPVLDDLRATSSAGFLPGLQDGITALLPVLPQAKSDIGDVAVALGHVSSELGHSLGSPYWADFTHLMVSQSIPAIDLGYRVISNFAIGLAGLTKAFLPLGQNLGGGILNFSERFAVASNNLDKNKTFQALLNYAITQGPVAAHTISDIVTALLHIAQALGPLGAPSLTILRLLAGAINGLPVGALQFLAQAAVLLGVAFKTWDIIKLVRDSDVVTNAISGLQSVVIGARGAMADAGPTAGRFGIALAAVKGGASEASAGLGLMFRSIGPVGLAITAASIVLGIFLQQITDQAQKAAENKQQVDTLTASLHGLADNYDGVSKASDDYLRNQVKTDSNFRDLILNTSKLGLSVDTISHALHGNTGALNDVNAAYDRQISTYQTFATLLTRQASDIALTKDEWAQYNAIIAAHPELAKLSYDEVIKLTDGTRDQKAAIDAAAQAERDQAVALGILDGASKSAQTSTLDLGALITTLQSKTASATDKINALKDAEDALAGSQKSLADAQHAFNGGLIQLDESLSNVNTRFLDSKGAVDDTTSAGHNFIDVLKSEVEGSQDIYNATLAATGSVEQATAARDAAIKKIYDEIDASSLSRKEKEALKAETESLIGTYGQIPLSKVTDVSVTGVDGVQQQLDSLWILQRALTQGISIEQATKDYAGEKKIRDQFAGHNQAEGGPIFGPGGPKDDLIPAWLSNGEYVIPAHVVGTFGLDFFDQLIGRKGPKARFPGDGSSGIALAEGGLAWDRGDWPFPVNMAGTKIPTRDQVISAIQFGPTWNGPVSGNIASAQAWLHAQSGKPYGWAQAGPGSYDCSGLLSSLWNILHNRNPYQHTFSTSNERSYFPLPGWGLFTAGWTNPGEPGPGGNSVGHTAGVLAGLPFESRGGAGVVVGSGVTPVTSFAHLGHYADGGLVTGQTLRSRLYDEGGWLQPGWGFNGSSRPEAVLNDQQWADISAAARAPAMAGHTYNFEFRDTTLTPARLQAIQDQEAARYRIERRN